MATINMHMKFEIEIPKQTWLMLRKPCRLQTDGRTDGQTDKVNPVYPPSNFVGRGYNHMHTICKWGDNLHTVTIFRNERFNIITVQNLIDIFKIFILPYIWSSRDPTIKTHGDSVGYKTLVMKNIRRIPLILFCSFVFHDLTNGVKLILPVRLPCNSNNMQNFFFTNILDPTNQYYLARRSAYMVSHYALLITSPYRIPQLQQTNFILITFPDPSRVE